MTEAQNLVTKVLPLEQDQMDSRVLMEEANHALGASMDTAPVRIDAERLHQLSSVALNSDICGSF